MDLKELEQLKEEEDELSIKLYEATAEAQLKKEHEAVRERIEKERDDIRDLINSVQTIDPSALSFKKKKLKLQSFILTRYRPERYRIYKYECYPKAIFKRISYRGFNITTYLAMIMALLCAGFYINRIEWGPLIGAVVFCLICIAMQILRLEYLYNNDILYIKSRQCTLMNLAQLRNEIENHVQQKIQIRKNNIKKKKMEIELTTFKSTNDEHPLFCAQCGAVKGRAKWD